MSKVRRVLRVVLLVLPAGLAALAGINHWNTRPLPFDRSVWDAPAQDIDDYRRHRMADGLLKEGRLIGMTRAEVADLLGEPTGTSRFREYDLVYVLGNERGWISIDSEWLLMRLDAAGRVVTAELGRD